MDIRDLKLGIYEKAMPGGISWSERLSIAGRAGYQFVEMSVDETDERIARLDWDREARRKFAEAVLESTLTVPSMCLSGHRRFPLGSRDRSVRNRARELVGKAIRFSSDTGIRTIQLAGYDVYYEESDGDTRKWFLDGLHYAVDIASRENVMLAMEIMDHPFMRSILRFLNIYSDFKSPWFKLYPDLGNLSAWGNDVSEELRAGSEHIVAVHLKDTLAVTESFPGQFRDLPFGEGCVDFAAAFETLKDMDYRGPFVVEMWTEGRDDAETRIEEARAWIIRRMEEAGYIERGPEGRGRMG